MLVGMIADIHGNALALEACLRQLARMHIGKLFFLGDLVGYLPGEQEALSLLRSCGTTVQKGNHEAMLLRPDDRAGDNEEVYRLEAARTRLGSGGMRAISAWPDHTEITLDNRKILLIHGSPADYLNGYLHQDADLADVTRMVNPCGRPGTLGLSVSEAGVLAMQMGSPP